MEVDKIIKNIVLNPVFSTGAGVEVVITVLKEVLETVVRTGTAPERLSLEIAASEGLEPVPAAVIASVPAAVEAEIVCVVTKTMVLTNVLFTGAGNRVET